MVKRAQQSSDTGPGKVVVICEAQESEAACVIIAGSDSTDLSSVVPYHWTLIPSFHELLLLFLMAKC